MIEVRPRVNKTHEDSYLILEPLKSMDFAFDVQTVEIFENLFSFYGSMDPQGLVINLSGKIFEKTETNPKLLVGHSFADTVFWQSSAENYQIIQEAIEAACKGFISKTILDFRISADQKTAVELSLFPVFDKEKKERKIKHIFISGQEVGMLRQEVEFYKKRSENYLYAAENANIGLWFWDLVEDKFTSTPKCNEFFEVPAYETFTYQAFLDVLHPDDRPQIIEQLRESQENGSEYESEFRVLYADGIIHWISARGKTYLDAEGNPATMMGIVRKITDRKNAEKELSRVYEREKKARDEAEEANRSKDYFLALVTHELRSPLNAILGWTKILLTKNTDEETRRNALETIERSATSQAKLLGDLVDSARIASGKLRLELRPVNLYEIIKTVFNSQKPAADAQQINLEFHCDRQNIQVFGDLVRLQQVFSNLLSNALKFTDENGNVSINVQTNNEKVAISFKDDGQGISPESLPKIFRQFSQGDDNSRKNGGLGLGLSIVKILTEKHGGIVTAQSDGPGQGAEFKVELPLFVSQKPVPLQQPELPDLTGRSLSNLKILLIEDDPDSREVLHLFLEQNGARVKSVESARKAIEMLEHSENGSFDAIISDLGMPNEDGYSLISRIRAFPDEKVGKIPAMALSAFATKENRDKAYSCGFQKYHTKPFEPDLLIKDILGLIRK